MGFSTVDESKEKTLLTDSEKLRVALKIKCGKAPSKEAKSLRGILVLVSAPALGD